MDPWLERPGMFPDFHDRLIAALGAAINALLPPPYYTAIANRIWLEGPNRHIEPDVDILHQPHANGIAAPKSEDSTGRAVVVAVQARPVIVHAPRDEVIERFLEVHSAPDGEHLVTSIEVLSLSNKREGSRGRKEYLQKQNEMLDSEVNLVEIDLLRGGTHTTSVSLDKAIEKTGPFDYHVCVHRFSTLDDYEVYPIRLPAPLPLIAIPLLPGAADIVVNLQELISNCYDTALYSRRIRYREFRPEPPLTEAQAQWAEQTLREKGLVPST